MNELEWLLFASVGLSWLVANMVLRRAEHWQLVQVPNQVLSQSFRAVEDDR